MTEGRRWIASDILVNAHDFVAAADMLTTKVWLGDSGWEELRGKWRAQMKEWTKQSSDWKQKLPQWLKDNGVDGILSLRASSAAGASARFPWISPAGGVDPTGTLRYKTGRRLLDGGIAESSSGLTAWEVLNAIRSKCTPEGDQEDLLLCRLNGDGSDFVRAGGKEVYVRPAILQVTNDAWELANADHDDGLMGKLGYTLPSFSEFIDPLTGLMQSRGGRGLEAYNRLLGLPSTQTGVARWKLEWPLELRDCRMEDESVPTTWLLKESTVRIVKDRLAYLGGARKIREWFDVIVRSQAVKNSKGSALGPADFVDTCPRTPSSGSTRMGSSGDAGVPRTRDGTRTAP